MNFSTISTFLRKKLVPQLEEAISQKEDAVRLTAEIYEKAEQVLPLFEKIDTLVYHYDQANTDGKITIEEGKQLFGDLKVVASDPAISELRTFLERMC